MKPYANNTKMIVPIKAVNREISKYSFPDDFKLMVSKLKTRRVLSVSVIRMGETFFRIDIDIDNGVTLWETPNTTPVLTDVIGSFEEFMNLLRKGYFYSSDFDMQLLMIIKRFKFHIY